MNRKNRFDLKNKIHVTASFMIKSALVLSIFGMLAATAHAGAFLREIPKYDESFETVTLLDGSTVEVIDRSREETSQADTYVHYNYQLADDENEISYGYYTGPDYYGPTSNDTVYYLGTFSGNYGNETDLLPLLQYFMDDTSLTNLGYEKIDNVFDDIGNITTFEGANLTVNVTDKKTNTNGTVEALGGTWEFEKAGSAETIDFYVVKGGPEYALYYVNPAQSSGTWTTAHLLDTGEQRGLSYLSVMKTTDIIDNPPEDPGAVPEPATMLLFGISLMGLAGMARRRNSKF